VVAGIYFEFLTILCFLAVAMSIVIVHLHTNSIAVRPRNVPELVSSFHSSRTNCVVPVIYTVSQKNCAKLFLSELRQISTDLYNFWQNDSKEARIFHLI